MSVRRSLSQAVSWVLLELALYWCPFVPLFSIGFTLFFLHSFFFFLFYFLSSAYFSFASVLFLCTCCFFLFPPMIIVNAVSWKYKRRIRVGTCKMLASYLRESLSLKTTTRGCRRPSSLIKTRNENSTKKRRNQNPAASFFPTPKPCISTSLENPTELIFPANHNIAVGERLIKRNGGEIRQWDTRRIGTVAVEDRLKNGRNRILKEVKTE